MSTNHQDEVAQAVRDRCAKDGRPDLFGERYAAACADRGIRPDAATASPGIELDPIRRQLAADDLRLDAIERSINQEKFERRWGVGPEGPPAVGPPQAACDRAVARCTAAGDPDNFGRYLADELALA